MIHAVKEIGDIILRRDGKSALGTLVQNPKSENVICIVFEKNESGFTFLEVKLEEFDEGKINEYLYRKGSPNGTNITPVSKVTGLAKTFNLKIKNWFEGMDLSLLGLDEEDKTFLTDLQSAFRLSEAEILQRIMEYEDLKNSMITIKIKEDDEKYIGEFSPFCNYLLRAVNQKDSKVGSKNRVCSLCGTTKDSVIGRLDTFKFYTLDKPGFISGGFREEEAWKNYPVCVECKLSLEEGKNFLIEKRRFNFYGIFYYIIPKFIIGSDEAGGRIINVLEEITREEQKVTERDGKEIERREERILRILARYNDFVTFSFLFLSREQSGSVERVLLLVEDVLPSRLRIIFQIKKEIDDIFGEKFKFGFGRIRNFFSKSDKGKRNNDLDKYFLEIVDKTMKGGRLDFNFILQVMLNKIRKDFIESEAGDGFYYGVKDALEDLIFFEKLGLIDFKETSMHTDIFSPFFEKYGKSFSSPETRGIFLLGTLTELLLRKQHSEREAKPFMKHLKSLKLGEREIKGLLPKVQDKLEQYKSFDKGKREIAGAVSMYLLEAGSSWKSSNDEINFYLACGMNMANEITNLVYKGEENDEQS